jgi:hypothetical protein
MERSVRVNAFADAGGPDEGFGIRPAGEFSIDPREDGGEGSTIPQPRMTISGAAKGDQGPCLYLGPGGQRCDRRAVRDGFCSRHLPGATVGKTSTTPSKKVIAALIAISGILWPYLEDIVREVLRWIHSH